MSTLQEVLDDLDPKSIDVLRAIAECDGSATTTEIRDVTGLSNSEVAYRRNKLTEYGLITVRTAESEGSRTPPKLHSLTETAHAHIESGLFDLYNAPVTGDVEQLSKQYNHLRDRVDELTETVERLEESIESAHRDLNKRVGNHAEIRDATDGQKMARAVGTLRSEVAELQEEVEELDERKKDKFRVFQ